MASFALRLSRLVHSSLFATVTGQLVFLNVMGILTMVATLTTSGIGPMGLGVDADKIWDQDVERFGRRNVLRHKNQQKYVQNKTNIQVLNVVKQIISRGVV